jgi:hypothetical protein
MGCVLPNAGLHVLCEKPFAPNAAAARRCRYARRSSDVLLAESLLEDGVANARVLEAARPSTGGVSVGA